MKLFNLPVQATFYTAVFLTFGCEPKRDFVSFMANEIGSLGGRTNGLAGSTVILGEWKAEHDSLGAAINTQGIQFETITNVLTAAYGEPQFYCAANERHGPTYIYPQTKIGISIFVSSTKTGAEVTLTKPIAKSP